MRRILMVAGVTSEPPRLSWRLVLLGTGQQGCGRLLNEGGLELGGRDHAQLAVQAAVVEPVDVLKRGVLHVVEPPPGASMADQRGLVQAVERLGQRIVVAVAARAD